MSIAAHEYTKGNLTVATDNPVYTPWFVNNKPANGKGYESAVVYAIAKMLGVSKSKVTWVPSPSTRATRPGPKTFDFDINEISYTPTRAKVVTFSTSYYDVQQSIVALKTDAIATKHSPAQLQDLPVRRPDRHDRPRLHQRPDQADEARARVLDARPGGASRSRTARSTRSSSTRRPASTWRRAQITGKNHKPEVATQVGQFPSVGEHYGLLFQKGNPLVGCVNYAISALKGNGTLAALAKKWLGIYTSVPVIQP